MNLEEKQTIEANQRFSQSILWQLQRTFFSLQGEKAWSQGVVPHYITSNPYIAQAYARVMFGWLRDVADSLDQSQPVYILELGAGSGRFSFHFLKLFFDFFDKSALRHIPITYVMSDFTKTTLQFWKQHKQLKPWIESGRLDFAKFDAEQDNALVLINQGTRLTRDTLKNPLALIANYFFDGLTQDIFRIKSGALHESLVTLTAPASVTDLKDPDLLQQLELTYEYQPVETTDYYEDSDFNVLLHAYELTLSQTTLLFPIGSLECLRRMLDLSNHNLFLLTADKGFHHKTDLLYRGEPGVAVHGSFSMMVNYHALGEYAQLQGGQFLSTPHHHTSLDICGMIFGQHPDDYPETQHSFTQNIVQNNPDDFFTIKKTVGSQDGEFEIEQFLAYLRFSGWDSAVFFEYFTEVLQVLEDVSVAVRKELYWTAKQVWDMYFFIAEERDLAFTLGGMLYGLEYYPEAIEYLNHSLQLYGDHPTTLCNIAMCHYDLNQLDTALEFVNRSLKIDPLFESARELLIKVESELEVHQ